MLLPSPGRTRQPSKPFCASSAMQKRLQPGCSPGGLTRSESSALEPALVRQLYLASLFLAAGTECLLSGAASWIWTLRSREFGFALGAFWSLTLLGSFLLLFGWVTIALALRDIQSSGASDSKEWSRSITRIFLLSVILLLAALPIGALVGGYFFWTGGFPYIPVVYAPAVLAQAALFRRFVRHLRHKRAARLVRLGASSLAAIAGLALVGFLIGIAASPRIPRYDPLFYSDNRFFSAFWLSMGGLLTVGYTTLALGFRWEYGASQELGGSDVPAPSRDQSHAQGNVFLKRTESVGLPGRVRDALVLRARRSKYHLGGASTRPCTGSSSGGEPTSGRTRWGYSDRMFPVEAG